MEVHTSCMQLVKNSRIARRDPTGRYILACSKGTTNTGTTNTGGGGAPLCELIDEVHAALRAVEGAFGLGVARPQLAHAGRHRVADHTGHASELQHNVLHR